MNSAVSRSRIEERILSLVRDEMGLDFNLYRDSTLKRRIERRAAATGNPNLEHYHAVLKTDASERASLFHELLIDVTDFFRDIEPFEALEARVLPRLFAEAAAASRPLRLWSAGCSTGQEAYSLAILAAEVAETTAHRDVVVQIFATDVDATALGVATDGWFTEEQVRSLSETRLERFFRRRDDGFEIVPAIRSTITFSRHNLLVDPPFSRVDLAACRNLLIYLTAEGQAAALDALFAGTRPGGVIMLGASEDEGVLATSVDVIDRHWRILRTRHQPRESRSVELAGPATAPMRPLEPNVRSTVNIDRRVLRAYDAILDAHIAAGLLIDQGRTLVHTFGQATGWLSQPGGRPTLDAVQLIEDPALRVAVAATLRQLTATPEHRTSHPVIVPTSDGPSSGQLIGQAVDVSGSRLSLVHFVASNDDHVEPVDVELGLGSSAGAIGSYSALEADLLATRESLESALDEQQRMNQELTTVNEELTAANEELQSTIEELSSVNAELRSLNETHRRNVADLEALTTDLDQLMLSTGTGVIFLNQDLEVRRITANVSRYFRVRPADLGRPLGDLVSHLELPDLVRRIEDVVADGQRYNERVGLVTEPDAVVSINAARFVDGAGQIGAFIAVTDVTETMKALGREAEFGRLLAQAPLVLVAKDGDGRFWYKNRMAEELTGPGIGTNDRDVLPAYVADQIEALDDRVRQLQEPLQSYESGEVEGEYRGYLTMRFPLENQGVASVAIRLEEDPQSVADRDRVMRQRVANTLTLAVIEQSGDELVDVDGRFERLTGLPPSTSVGSVHPDDQERLVQAMLAKESAIPARLHLADGSWRHVNYHVDYEAGERYRLIFIVDRHEDVVQQDQATRELAQLQTQMMERTANLEDNVSNLAERNADLDSFAHAAAHDLKAPIRAMVAFSELASEAIDEEHPAQAHLERVQEGSYRMATMVDSMLSLASAGRDALSVRPCDVAQMLEQAQRDLAVQIDEAGAEFDIGPLDKVLADAGSLTAILSNLISNAMKYTDGRPPRITIRSSVEDRMAVITVQDNGIGFDQARAIEIFEPFRRLHPRDRFQGTGVGLAICRRLAQRLGGEIWATSTPGEGSVFSLRLPMAPAEL